MANGWMNNGVLPPPAASPLRCLPKERMINGAIRGNKFPFEPPNCFFHALTPSLTPLLSLACLESCLAIQDRTDGGNECPSDKISVTNLHAILLRFMWERKLHMWRVFVGIIRNSRCGLFAPRNRFSVRRRGARRDRRRDRRREAATKAN